MPSSTTMATTATGARAANMPTATAATAASSARGCWPRHRRGMGDWLQTLLATIAIVSCFLRTLYASERTVRYRPADGFGVLNWSGRGSGNINGAFATKIIDRPATRGRGAGTIN